MIHIKKMAYVYAVGAAIVLAGCVDDGTNGASNSVTAENFDFVTMLGNYADNIIVPNYQAVAQSAALLSATNGPIDSYCAAIGGGSEAAAIATAESAWQDLMAAIQQTELHILGPAAENNSNLRNRLNAFNSAALSTCGIDGSVILASQDSNFDVADRSINQRGIGSIEYLLFNANLNHTCPSQITTTATWNSLPEDDRKRLRCDYALQIAQDVSVTADVIVDAWSSSGGDYRSTFTNPNNLAESLEALSDALFYLDIEVKDEKVGIPTGINSACTSFACPEGVESPFTENSLENIRNNLVAFQQMLVGGSGLGFDDIIQQAGVPELNDSFDASVSQAIAIIDGAAASLRDDTAAITDANDAAACANDAANPSEPGTFSACRLAGALKLITDDLKVGFVAAVAVDLPDRAQSDND